MKKTREFYGSGYYVFESKASANSLYFENMKEVRLFFKYVDYFLSDFIKIHEYLITKDGWTMQVTIRDKKSILKNYEKCRDRSIDCDRKLDHKEVWKIVSERVRLMISHYVKNSNFSERREGSKVKESYQKFYFESFQEAKSHMESLRNQTKTHYQRKRKYRGLKCYYSISKKRAIGHVYLCTKWIEKDKKRAKLTMEKALKCLVLKDFSNMVVPKMIQSTANFHKPPI